MKSAWNSRRRCAATGPQSRKPAPLRHPAWLKLVLFGTLMGSSCGGGQSQAGSPAQEKQGRTEQRPPNCDSRERCESACDGDDAAACEWAGRMYETGEGAPQDYPQAAKLYDKACRGGREQACTDLAVIYNIGLAVETDPGRANELYRKACDAGHSWACKRVDQLDE